jgi:hypothetical protein
MRTKFYEIFMRWGGGRETYCILCGNMELAICKREKRKEKRGIYRDSRSTFVESLGCLEVM